MKKIFTLLATSAMLLVGLMANAKEDRAMFMTALNAIPNKAEVFVPGGAWFPYPAYEDRQAWDKLTGPYKESMIKRGEKCLGMKWNSMPASIYLEYEQSKDRSLMGKYDHPYREAFTDLVLAELAEGKGRFMTDIINGLYYTAERTAWSHGQHTTAQRSGRTLPTPDDKVVSLISAVLSTNVAVAWHFFHNAWDKIDPAISRRALTALEENSFKPYMERDWSWMGLKRKEGQKVNNWNCYCNYFTAISFLLADQNKERLLKAIERFTYSFDQYVDYVGRDGACEEGSFYWTMASAKVYEFARLMCDASLGKMDVLKDWQIAAMGAYMSNCYIGDGWIVDVSDGDARLGPDVMYRDLFFRYGLDTGCKELENIAVSFMADPANKVFKPMEIRAREEARELYRALENLRYRERLEAAQQAALNAAGGDWNKMIFNLTKDIKSHWYNETEIATLRNTNGWYLGAKAGNNGESHGHLDVGSCLVFVDSCPVFIDPGVETYAKTTFGAPRKDQWWFSTLWHNLPIINGCVQKDGHDSKASNVKCDPAKGTMSCNLATAYPDEAAVSSWIRSYRLESDGVTVSDSYKLKERKTADDVHFVCDGDIALPGETVDGYVVKNGEVVVKAKSYDRSRGVNVRMTYPTSLTPSVSKIEMTDPRFIKVWHESVQKVTFTSNADATLSGKYEFRISRL